MKKRSGFPRTCSDTYRPSGGENGREERNAMEEKRKRCRYCNEIMLSDGETCPNCGKRKQNPFYLQGEFWGLMIALAISVIALAAAIMNL